MAAADFVSFGCMRLPPPEYLQHFATDLPVEGGLTVNPYYFVLWRPEEIEQMNREYEVPQYAPEYLGFATSGGGEMLAFDSQNRIFAIPFIGMSSKDAIKVASTWNEFLNFMQE